MFCSLVGCFSDNSNPVSNQHYGIIEGTLLGDEPIAYHVVGLLNMESSSTVQVL